MEILKTEYKQRAFDGRWELLGQILDEENAYVYRDDNKSKRVLFPTKWITLAVYDYELVIED